MTDYDTNDARVRLALPVILSLSKEFDAIRARRTLEDQFTEGGEPLGPIGEIVSASARIFNEACQDSNQPCTPADVDTAWHADDLDLFLVALPALLALCDNLTREPS